MDVSATFTLCIHSLRQYLEEMHPRFSVHTETQHNGGLPHYKSRQFSVGL